MGLNYRFNQGTLKWIAVLLIALAALTLRVYAIDRLPPGLFGDEAVEGLDALDILAGNFAIWFHAHLGREPLYVYLVALSYAAFGVSALATRLPAIVAGLLTLPVAFLFAREWASALHERATRIALLATALLAISFWHIQMSRDAHRDTLLPLVEAFGYWLLWLAIRTKKLKAWAAAGAVLGLAVYTYSPGRFVGIFIGLFFAVEFILAKFNKVSTIAWQWRGLVVAGLLAILVMLPIGVYFLQNPVQFSRRFESVSVFDATSPSAALAESITGNLAQLVVPGAGYQSKHYNLPGKPIFDLLVAPWFLAGIIVAVARWKQSPYRFLLLWFAVMLLPAFLTADMIPKAVRALGIVPGIFIFPALAMDWLLEQAQQQQGRPWHRVVAGLVGLTLVGSTVWTAYDYFIVWANIPELPLAFDADMTEVSEFLQRQPADRPIYISSLVYRPPTEMLLGRRVPTTHYVDPAGHIKEFDAQTALVSHSGDVNPVYVWVLDQNPPEEWLARLAPDAVPEEQGRYIKAVRLNVIAPPQQALDVSFNPLVKLVGYSRFRDEPSGMALYWQVTQLAGDRGDMQAVLSISGARGSLVSQDKHKFGVPPLEWAVGDTIVEWYALDIPENAAAFSIQLARGDVNWQSPVIPLKGP